MTRTPAEITHLSQSSINTFLQCPRQWAAYYLDEEPRRKGVALIKGSTVDKVATYNWNRKREYGEDISIEEGQHLAEDLYRAEVDNAGGRGEVDWGRENFIKAMDSSVRMAARHLRDHAPLYTPTATQCRAERWLPDNSRTVLGFIDAMTDEVVIDVKTGGRKMARGDADIDIQPTAYAWLLERPIHFEYLRVIDSGRSPVTSEIVRTVRGVAALQWFETLAQTVSASIDAGNFPTRPGWHCGFCPKQNVCVGALTGSTLQLVGEDDE